MSQDELRIESGESTMRLKPRERRLLTFLSPTGNAGDAVFRALVFGAGLLIFVIVAGMIIALAVESIPSIREFGFGFLWGREWNPVKSEFGAAPFIYGTVVFS